MRLRSGCRSGATDAPMLRHWLQYFGHEQIALIRSEEYFKDPRATLSRLFDHLGVDQPSDTASACVLLGLVWLRVCVCAPDLVYALWGAAADAASWSTLAGVRNLSGTVRAPCRLIQRTNTALVQPPPYTAGGASDSHRATTRPFYNTHAYLRGGHAGQVHPQTAPPQTQPYAVRPGVDMPGMPVTCWDACHTGPDAGVGHDGHADTVGHGPSVFHRARRQA